MAADAVQRIKQAEQEAARLEREGAQKKAAILEQAKKQAAAGQEALLRQAKEQADQILQAAREQAEENARRELSLGEEEIAALKCGAEQRAAQAVEQIMKNMMAGPAGEKGG